MYDGNVTIIWEHYRFVNNSMNKAAHPHQRREQPPAEFVEKRPLAKRDCVETTVTDTQGLEAASTSNIPHQIPLMRIPIPEVFPLALEPV